MADVPGHWPCAELCGAHLLGGQLHVNNVVTIVNYFNKLEDLLPVIGEV